MRRILCCHQCRLEWDAMPKRLFIAIAVTAALALAAIAIFGIFAFEGGDKSAPPAHVEPMPSTPEPSAPANP